MTDSTFEQLLDRQLREYADGGVQPFDRYAIAEGLIATRRRRWSWLPALGRPILSPTMAIVVLGLLLAMVVAIVAGALVLRLQLDSPIGRNGVIAFSLWDMPEGPYNHLHLVQPDGTGDREIAQGTAASFSGDGTSLAYFTGWGAGEPDLRLVVADADGANPREVVPYFQSGFAYSPDGSQFAVVTGWDRSSESADNSAVGSIWLVSIPSGEKRELVPSPEEGIRYWDVSWSPDGEYLAYEVTKEVTSADNGGTQRIAVDVVDVQTGEVRRISERLGTDATGHVWSPDSKTLAFLGLPDGSPEMVLPRGDGTGGSWWLPEDIFLVRVDGTGETNITNSEAFESGLQWSPNGRAVAYTTQDPDGARLNMIRINGFTAVGTPTSGPLVDEFKWSPDARRIVYTRNVETSPPNADVQEFEGTIRTIDAQFTEEPFVVVTFDYMVGGLAWQWLEP